MSIFKVALLQKIIHVQQMCLIYRELFVCLTNEDFLLFTMFLFVWKMYGLRKRSSGWHAVGYLLNDDEETALILTNRDGREAKIWRTLVKPAFLHTSHVKLRIVAFVDVALKKKEILNFIILIALQLHDMILILHIFLHIQNKFLRKKCVKLLIWVCFWPVNCI